MKGRRARRPASDHCSETMNFDTRAGPVGPRCVSRGPAASSRTHQNIATATGRAAANAGTDGHGGSSSTARESPGTAGGARALNSEAAEVLETTATGPDTARHSVGATGAMRGEIGARPENGWPIIAARLEFRGVASTRSARFGQRPCFADDRHEARPAVNPDSPRRAQAFTVPGRISDEECSKADATRSAGARGARNRQIETLANAVLYQVRCF